MPSIAASTADRFIGNQYGPSTTLTIKNLQKDRDTMALQCNITNNLAGSWVHTSFFLNVKCRFSSLCRCSYVLCETEALADEYMESFTC